ncbi:MAG: bifunctional enoyl-CoA hydratase/phosphate acetyltransferase [Clostridia bacterium]|nr:bifunctional enoyl-CoA hydratase/phosphate acetyltransferase [Clostridia bacterium]
MKEEFLRMIDIAKSTGPKKLTVACPYHASSLLSSLMAQKDGLAIPILVGDKNRIMHAAEEDDVDISSLEIIDIKDDQAACDKAVQLVAEGKADFVMKGLIDTSVILKAYLKPEFGMRTDKLLSHVAVFNPDSYGKILFVTDASMNIDPDLDQKRQIIDNAVDVARKMGVEVPKVAVLAAIEKVNPKMPETVEARALQEMNEKGIIKNSIVAGPLALDNAIFEKAAKIKSIDHPVAGHADILMVPNIEIGNILYKALAFCSGAKHAGVIVGGKKPVVLTSRSDNEFGKYNSIAFAKYLLETGDGYNKL